MTWINGADAIATITFPVTFNTVFTAITNTCNVRADVYGANIKKLTLSKMEVWFDNMQAVDYTNTWLAIGC